MKKTIAVISGAGISAESGLSTFRDSGGLWNKHRIEDVATPEAWIKNPELVLDFYNQRRRQLKEVKPNPAHLLLHELENFYHVEIITQNVDDLHERAGSTSVLHLHGELVKSRSSVHDHLVYDQTDDILPGHTCEKGFQLRPHIVWFGEAVPLIENAVEIIAKADIIIIVGTSLQVYPAAGLITTAKNPDIPLYHIDPAPTLNYEVKRHKNLISLPYKATVGMERLYHILTSEQEY